MSFDQIEIFPWIIEQLQILDNLNSNFIIATNQPAAAKGKILYSELIDIHYEILKRIEPIVILDSFICHHRSEDSCQCLKPKTGLLKLAFYSYPEFNKNESWIVGDRATDIICGHTFGLKTALLGPSVESDMDILNNLNIKPTYHGTDLRDFVEMIKAL